MVLRTDIGELALLLDENYGNDVLVSKAANALSEQRFEWGKDQKSQVK
jgi:hypothetical protein